ncbi:hypothetical protein CHS0354_009699 [Potamilus streckersoni]|uniref:Uncharacterized protein n=1 Tax=Potamilus streckersoni TaxID=2493646 RepID=A0AAE0S0J9_9BIVA|nr:hypothetical protein CHS0354_009699 [Potamilus streckersoni]
MKLFSIAISGYVEAEHASDLLDQLYIQANAVNGDQVKKQTDMSKKDNKTKAKEKERKDAPEKKKRETDNVLKHDEKFQLVSFVLKKMDEANK